MAFASVVYTRAHPELLERAGVKLWVVLPLILAAGLLGSAISGLVRMASRSLLAQMLAGIAAFFPMVAVVSYVVFPLSQYGYARFLVAALIFCAILGAPLGVYDWRLIKLDEEIAMRFPGERHVASDEE